MSFDSKAPNTVSCVYWTSSLATNVCTDTADDTTSVAGAVRSGVLAALGRGHRRGYPVTQCNVVVVKHAWRPL